MTEFQASVWGLNASDGIGRLLKAGRESMGLDSSEMVVLLWSEYEGDEAQELRISEKRALLTQWENGESVPEEEQTLRISRVLGLPTSLVAEFRATQIENQIHVAAPIGLESCSRCDAQFYEHEGYYSSEGLVCTVACANRLDFCRNCQGEMDFDRPFPGAEIHIWNYIIYFGTKVLGSAKRCDTCMSYISTKWLFILLPIIPLGSYRLIDVPSDDMEADTSVDGASTKIHMPHLLGVLSISLAILLFVAFESMPRQTGVIAGAEVTDMEGYNESESYADQMADDMADDEPFEPDPKEPSAAEQEEVVKRIVDGSQAYQLLKYCCESNPGWRALDDDNYRSRGRRRGRGVWSKGAYDCIGRSDFSSILFVRCVCGDEYEKTYQCNTLLQTRDGRQEPLSPVRHLRHGHNNQ